MESFGKEVLLQLDKQTDNTSIDLNASDRCDACGAQAYVYCKGLEGSLYFCGHHYNQHKDKLDDWAFTIIDQRDKLSNKETTEEE
ncbi:MAG: hypothetical protein RLZZ196_1941 [Bacteroidota bacterium]|jgi:hypothetical protein